MDRALAEKVDAVLLAGDLVDRDNRYFESYGPLESGFRRLAEGGIDIVAVAGNHDYDTLPRLFRSLARDPGLESRLHFLGAEGCWESLDLTREDGEVLRVLGWSFPAEHVRRSPFADRAPDPSTDAVTIGLLHADLDQPRSPYAPLSASDLEGRPEALWVLGHIHSGRWIEKPGCPPVLYAGSPQPLDPAETGEHSVALVTLDGSSCIGIERCLLATVRYDTVSVDVTGADDGEMLEEGILGALRAHADGLDAAAGSLRHLCCRVRLEGSTPLHGTLEDRLGGLLDDLHRPVGRLEVHVEKVDCDTRPALVLEDLARSLDAPGVLARLLLSLEGRAEYPGADALVKECIERLQRVYRARPYQLLRSRSSSGVLSGNPREEGEAARLETPTADLARQLLRRQGLLLLDALLAQKGPAA